MTTARSLFLGLAPWLLFCAPASAQAPEFRWQLGGPIVDTWVEADPAHPGELLVWTAEAGPRIRRLETATGTAVFEPIVMQQPWTSHALHHVFVSADLAYGIAVGSNGRGYWAVDVGAGPTVWKALATSPSRTGAHLWESFVESRIARDPFIVVAGEGDTLVWTDSALGLLWKRAVTPPLPAGATRDFFCLAFADHDLVPLGKRLGLAGVRVLDAQQNVLYQGLYRTTDGVTWSESTVILPPEFGDDLVVWDVDFVPGSTQEAFAVGGEGFGNGRGYAFRTVDGGQTWLPTRPECSSTVKRPVNCAPPSLQPNAVAPCTGTGANQSVGLQQQDTFVTLYGVAALSDGGAVAASYGGTTWRFDPITGEWADRLDTSVFETGPLWGAHSGRGLDRVFVSGQYGEVRRSDDGGWTWQQVFGGHKARMNDVAFGDPDNGWAVSQRYRILASTDGGANWAEQRSYRGTPWNASLTAVAARDGRNAVTIGPTRQQHPSCDPVVLFTLDGGADCWNEALLPGGPNGQCGTVLRDVAAARAPGLPAGGSRPVFWIVGRDALFWRSMDGGRSWTALALTGVPPAFDALAIAFASHRRAFVVGHVAGQGRAFRIDGADGPQPVAVDVTPAFPIGVLRGVAALADEAYAVGNAGVVLRYDPAAAQPAFGEAPGVYEWIGGQLAQYTTLPLNAVAMAGDSAGWTTLVAGAHGLVLREDSGSGAWQLVPSRTTDAIESVQLLARDLGWIVGSNADGALAGAHTPFGWGDSAILSWR